MEISASVTDLGTWRDRDHLPVLVEQGGDHRLAVAGVHGGALLYRFLGEVALGIQKFVGSGLSRQPNPADIGE